MSYLLDASVWLAAADIDDTFHGPALDLVRSEKAEHAALDLTVYEVGNVAIRRWGDPERARRLSLLVLTACAERLVRVDRELALAALEIAEQEALTVYDAAYVAAARQGDHVLVSGDVKDLVRTGFAVAPDQVEVEQ